MPMPPSWTPWRKWAEDDRAQPAVARMAEAAMASSTLMARRRGAQHWSTSSPCRGTW